MVAANCYSETITVKWGLTTLRNYMTDLVFKLDTSCAGD